MDWNRFQGNWKQLEGKVKERWGYVTNDERTVIRGRRDQWEGKLQERYGRVKDMVRQQIHKWASQQSR